VQSEYLHPVTDGVDGYIRGLFTYYPKNARATPARVIDNYGLLNFYAGVRAKDGAWDAGLFVRNAFNTDKLTFIAANESNNINGAITTYPSLIHSSGYFEKTLTPRREFGINVRYAFGSR
jgi:iron complex outermembrane receptor protein